MADKSIVFLCFILCSFDGLFTEIILNYEPYQVKLSSSNSRVKRMLTSEGDEYNCRMINTRRKRGVSSPEALGCPEEILENGNVVVTCNDKKCQAVYTCNECYTLLNNDKRNCLAGSGTYTKKAPECQLQENCTSVSPTEGTSTEANVTDSVTEAVTEPTEAPTEQPLDFGCESLPAPTDGEVTFDCSDTTKKICAADYTCNTCFTLDGTSQRKCKKGVWNKSPPVCVIQGDGCSTLNPCASSAPFCVNCVCQTCDDPEGKCEGTVTEPSTTKSTTTESTTTMEPLEFNCPSLPAPEGGSVSFDCSNVKNQVCVADYACNECFTLNGAVSQRCKEGSWNKSPPVCDIQGDGCSDSAPCRSTAPFCVNCTCQTCEDPLGDCDPEITTTTEGTTVETTTVTTTEAPKEVVMVSAKFGCPDLPTPDNTELSIRCSKKKKKCLANYSCKTNVCSNLEGSTKRACSESKPKWTNEEGVCIIQGDGCSDDSFCANKYNKVTDKRPFCVECVCQACDANGENCAINEEEGTTVTTTVDCPVCDVTCPSPTPDPNIDLSELDQCLSNPCANNGTCIDGYNSYTCSCADDWAGTNCDFRFVHVCKDVLEAPVNGKVINGRGDLGSVTTYICDDGYLIVNSKFRVCQANGFWSGQSPKCLKMPPGFKFDCPSTKQNPTVFDNFSEDPCDCSAFLHCSRDSIFQKSCPPGTQWNKDITMCSQPLQTFCRTRNATNPDSDCT
ncbi:unnamed protein product [Owenia fusiformis]|uniref:Uncharacterized protein n=1 Tax=Owenia fusiformis TaxID=6347 RepID=A0A8S4MVS7_OWEFU|nr:unnamed protein product [Owenia fusiformis]